jgi:hypothetical protein
MRRPSLPFCSVLVTILIVSAGCSRKPDDARISSDVQSKFSQDSGLSTKQLAVQSTNGVVTLSGTVDNDAQRDAASRQASSVAGVKEVINNLTIGSANPAAPAETANSSGMPPASASSAPSATNAKPIPGKSAARKASKAKATIDPSADQTRDSDGNQTAAQSSPSLPTQPDATPDKQPASPPPPPLPKKYIIDQGTQISVRLIDPIDSEKNQTGDTFHATLNAPLTSDGDEAVPAGVEVTGHLVEVKSAGKFAGQSDVVLQLDSMSSGGKTYNLQTDQWRKEGNSRGKNTAEKVGGGAVLGTIIGAIAGGGKGAAIGAAAGAGVGGGVQAASKSQQIKLPSETVLNLTLQAPVTVVQAPKPDANRQKLDDSQQ